MFRGEGAWRAGWDQTGAGRLTGRGGSSWGPVSGHRRVRGRAVQYHCATPSRTQIQHGSLAKRSGSLIVKHEGEKEIESSVYLHIKQFK